MIVYLSSVYTVGHVFTKQFLLTLAVGVAFGFSFALMLLNVTSLNRKEMFLGPPPARYSMDAHDHEVSWANTTKTSVVNPDPVESGISSWIRNYLFRIRIQAKIKKTDK